MTDAAQDQTLNMSHQTEIKETSPFFNLTSYCTPNSMYGLRIDIILDRIR